MKYILVLMSMLAFACNTSSSLTNSNGGNDIPTIEDPDERIDLSSHLRTIPGVDVRGSGANAEVYIRGPISMSQDNKPLFVVNGATFSGDYSQLYSTLDPNDIKRIEVIKGPKAAIYGSRGTNGVIKITTKSE